MVKLNNSWDERLKDEFSSEYYLALREFLKKEYSTKTVYPSAYDIFNSIKKVDYDDVSVVILGQDPYHTPGAAEGARGRPGRGGGRNWGGAAGWAEGVRKVAGSETTRRGDSTWCGCGCGDSLSSP